MTNTQTCVSVRIHSDRVAGRKPEAFTEKENAAMRHVLRGLRERGKWSLTETGRRVGIGQQAAGTILNKQGGFSRPTAMRLAVMCGFENPEVMLSDMGALADPNAAPKGWVWRDLACGHARRVGYDETAIERVVAKYTDTQYATMPMRWWMDRISNEARELDAERAAMPAAPVSSQMIEPKKRKRRKSA